MAARDNMKTSWADEDSDDEKPSSNAPAWGGWGAKAPAKEPVADVKKPVLPVDDFPTLNNPVRRSNGDKKEAYSAPRGGDSYDNRRGGDHEKKDTYEPPRRSGGGGGGGGGDGGGYERRESYDRREGYERRDSYDNRRGGDSYRGERDSYRGGDAPERTFESRRGGGEFRDSHDRRDSYDRYPRRDSYDNKGGDDVEPRGDTQDWRGSREEGAERREFRGGDREYRDRGDREYRDRGDRERAPRAPRPKLPLPTSPPFIAYIGNLYFNVQKEDVEDFFGVPCEVRLMTFQDTQKPRGYGYVTFETLEALEAALSKDGQNLMGRDIKVDVSEGAHQNSSTWGRGDRDSRNRDREPREGSRNRDSEHRDGSRNRDGEPQEPREPREPRDTPVERTKLVLAPRTLPVEAPVVPLPRQQPVSPSEREEPTSPSAESNQPKSNPFGDAKPRDQLAIQRAFEERQREKEKAEREKAEKEKAEREQRAGAAVEKKDDDTRGPRRDAAGPRRDDRDNRDNRDRRDAPRREASTDRPRDFNGRFNKDNRDNRDNRDTRDTRDNRDNRDNRGPRPTTTGARPQAPVTANKDQTKDNKPVVKAPAPAAVKSQEKKPAKEVANKFAVLNISEAECP